MTRGRGGSRAEVSVNQEMKLDIILGYLTFILGYGIFVQNYFEIF